MARFRADRLTELRKELGISQEELARRTGSTQPSITRLEAGGTDRPRNLVAIARELGCSPDYLLGETDDPKPITSNIRLPDPVEDSDLVAIEQIDLRYGMGATYLDVPVEAEKRVFSRTWLRNFTQAPPDKLFWATGEGDSMEPTIRSGETILIDMSQHTVRTSGSIWAVALGETGMIRRLHVPAKGRLQLLSDNAHIPPTDVADDELHIIGRVIAVVRRL